jgi:protein associated with RNAse G/E
MVQCHLHDSKIGYSLLLQSGISITGEAIKNIDYDLDVKVSPTGKTTLLDEDEYQEHSAEMGYSQKLDKAIHHGLDRLMVDIRLQNSPFEHREISALYDKYLRYMDEDKRMK